MEGFELFLLHLQEKLFLVKFIIDRTSKLIEELEFLEPSWLLLIEISALNLMHDVIENIFVKEFGVEDCLNVELSEQS